MSAFEEPSPLVVGDDDETSDDDERGRPLAATSEPEVFLPLRVLDVELILPATHPVLVLEEISPPKRHLRVPIGVNEGVAISYALRGVPTRKPLTHELFANVIAELGAVLEVVRITDIEGEIYAAELVFSGPQGRRVVPSRLSDGVALALRQALPAPVTIDADLLDRVAVAGG